jgi:hypothetical protein
MQTRTTVSDSHISINDYISNSDSNDIILLKNYKKKLCSCYYINKLFFYIKYYSCFLNKLCTNINCDYIYFILSIITIFEAYTAFIGGVGYLICLYNINQTNINGIIAYSSIDFSTVNYFTCGHAVFLIVGGTAFSVVYLKCCDRVVRP